MVRLQHYIFDFFFEGVVEKAGFVVSVDDQGYSSVYLAEDERAFSTGYFASFLAIF